MRFTLDDQARTITSQDGRVIDLFSQESFSLLSQQCLRVGWSLKHSYSFTWLGRPMIQLPEDVVRLQEVIYTVKPKLIIETGVAHGGSLMFLATLCSAIGRGRVVGVDIKIKDHNREAIETHELSRFITLIEGSSIDPDIIGKVTAEAHSADSVFVILDADHSLAHVTAELEAYAPLVTKGSYIVATDGAMEFLADVPRGKPEWRWDNPQEAAKKFVSRHPEFGLEEPKWLFNEGEIRERVTYWPNSYLRRL